MVRFILIVFILFTSVDADIYEQNCVTCHKSIPVSIDKYFYRYLLKYSSQRDVKRAMLEYMKNPSQESSVMPEAFISRFGVKQKSSLSEKELSQMIDIYWSRYKVSDKLK